jgi:ketosteroid isomerase-like protein
MVVKQQEHELKQFKKDFEEASKRKDRAALERMIHDDFTLVDPDGNRIDKKNLIDGIVHSQSNFAQNFGRSEHKTTIEINGNAARETAEVRMHGNLAQRGDVSGEYINTATYVHGPNGWQFLGNTLHRK